MRVCVRGQGSRIASFPGIEPELKPPCDLRKFGTIHVLMNTADNSLRCAHEIKTAGFVDNFVDCVGHLGVGMVVSLKIGDSHAPMRG